MKKTLLSGIAMTAITLGSIAPAHAEDTTIAGVASCGANHATIIKVNEQDTTIAYRLADNDVSKKFHKNVCQNSAKVRATGEVQRTDDGLRFVAKKIQLADKES